MRVERMDVASIDEVRALAGKLDGEAIDVLINNAGIYSDRAACGDEACRGEDCHAELRRARLRAVRHDHGRQRRGPSPRVGGVHRATCAPAGKRRSSRSARRTARSPSRSAGSGAIAYRASKAALNRAMQLVAVHERDEGVTVLLLHPGAVLTERQAHLTFPGMIRDAAERRRNDRADRQSHDRRYGTFHSIRRRDGALVTARSLGERSMKTTLALGAVAAALLADGCGQTRNNPRSPKTSRRSRRSTSAICDRSTRKTSQR